jgi:ArsR family transcriptional regulator
MGKLKKLFSALSDQSRLRIIAALKEYEDMCACQIVELLQLTGATTSKHLSILMQAGVLDRYKEGRWVHYHLDYSNNCCDQVMEWLEEQLYQTNTIKDDQLALKEIMSADREDICRKQRGEKCCPIKEQ